MRVCILAAPLNARSGVYRSTLELVEAARAAGLEWSAVVGVRAPLTVEREDPAPHVREVDFGGEHVLRRLRRLRKLLREEPALAEADVVISMLPLDDAALALTPRRGPWVAWVRGLPWRGEQEVSGLRRRAWMLVERLAFARAAEAWATTEVLAAQVGPAVGRRLPIVPAGVKLPPGGPQPAGATVTWAGRYDSDKNGALLLRIARDLAGRAPFAMYGFGPLEDDLRRDAPQALTVHGWAEPDAIWRDAAVFVGTSLREAFGRSAVEAASRGIPVVLGDEYGCAPLLYRDPELAARFVLPVAEEGRWTDAVAALLGDPALRARVSAHVRESADLLSIQSSVERVEERLRALLAPGRVSAPAGARRRRG